MKVRASYSLSLLLLLMCVFPAASQESMLCQGRHWTEDEGNLQMKKFALQWSTLEDWQSRSERIRRGIIEGMQLEKMPARSAPPITIIRDKKKS